jgi:hypothetical protein
MFANNNCSPELHGLHEPFATNITLQKQTLVSGNLQIKHTGNFTMHCLENYQKLITERIAA